MEKKVGINSEPKFMEMEIGAFPGMVFEPGAEGVEAIVIAQNIMNLGVRKSIE